ncbi:MAG: STAS domain-containing protein [Chloroflexi bacterium]|nr:STAS domain-containing protein [Chloroflexota bacterium]
MTESTLAIEQLELKHCDLFRMSGRIDGSTAPQFEEAMQATTNAGHYKIVLNLAEVSYMSSAALRVLISTSKECRKLKRGDVRLAEVNERIAQVLDLAGLNVLFKIFDSEAEAVDSF